MSPRTPVLLNDYMNWLWPGFENDESIILFILFQNLATIHLLLLMWNIQLQASNDRKYHNKWFSDNAKIKKFLEAQVFSSFVWHNEGKFRP